MLADEKSKTLGHKRPLRALFFGCLIALVVRIIFHTSRKRYIDAHHLQQFLDSGQPMIIAGWHNRDALAIFSYIAKRPRRRQILALASVSKDGEIASRALRLLGVKTMRGSSSRGGFKALKGLTTGLKQGFDVAMTPDGPRGPKYEVQGGVITAAKLSGAPIIPVIFQAKRKILLNSWDRFIVPFPFNRINFVYGEPLFVPRTCPATQIQEYADQLKAELMRILEVAEDFS